MTELGYKKLVVWERADKLAFQIYLETKKFPKDETYGVTSQLRRAVVSITLNIVEGVGRQGNKEFKNFINIALGSNAEVEYLLNFCFRLGYLDHSRYSELERDRQMVGVLLWRLYRSL